MFKNFVVFILIIGGALGISKVVIDKVNAASTDSAGEVHVVKKTSASANTSQLVSVEEVPFKKITKTTSALRAGTESVAQKGEPGEKTVIYSVEYKDGKEISRKKISERITKKPADEVIVKGTTVAP